MTIDDMGSFNKQSVREEADRIQAEFDKLSTSKKIDGEYQILFNSMLMLINLLISIFLEKTIHKNTKNSSKPSSQTEKDESALTNPGTTVKENLSLVRQPIIPEPSNLSR